MVNLRYIAKNLALKINTHSASHNTVVLIRDPVTQRQTAVDLTAYLKISSYCCLPLQGHAVCKQDIMAPEVADGESPSELTGIAPEWPLSNACCVRLVWIKPAATPPASAGPMPGQRLRCVCCRLERADWPIDDRGRTTDCKSTHFHEFPAIFYKSTFPGSGIKTWTSEEIYHCQFQY